MRFALLLPFSPARIAIMAMFFCSGFVYAIWGVHVPLIKAKFHFSDGELSLALFAVAGGAILAMGPLGRWIVRVGSAKACLWGGLLLAACVAPLLLVPSPLLLFPLLLAFGAANSLYDIAINAQASLLERQFARPLMSSLHGLFSLGGLCGSLVGSAWQGGGLPSWLLFVLSAGGVVAVTLAGRPHCLPEPVAAAEEAHGTGVRRQLLALGGLAFIGLVAEGGMYDWSSVYMGEGVQAGAGWVGLGYAGFSLGMTLGRFFGDRVRTRWGSTRTLQWSGILVLAGIAAALAVPLAVPAVAGFTLVGLGCANCVPVLMSRAATLPGVAAAEALALVGRLAYLGLLLGPVLIGFTADRAGLAAGIALIGAGGLVISLGTRRVLGLPEGQGAPTGGRG